MPAAEVFRAVLGERNALEETTVGVVLGFQKGVSRTGSLLRRHHHHVQGAVRKGRFDYEPSGRLNALVADSLIC